MCELCAVCECCNLPLSFTSSLRSASSPACVHFVYFFSCYLIVRHRSCRFFPICFLPSLLPNIPPDFATSTKTIIISHFPALTVPPVSLFNSVEMRRLWGWLGSAIGRNDGAGFYKKPAGSWIDGSCCQIAPYPERATEALQFLLAVSLLCTCVFLALCYCGCVSPVEVCVLEQAWPQQDAALATLNSLEQKISLGLWLCYLTNSSAALFSLWKHAVYSTVANNADGAREQKRSPPIHSSYNV